MPGIMKGNVNKKDQQMSQQVVLGDHKTFANQN